MEIGDMNPDSPVPTSYEQFAAAFTTSLPALREMRSVTSYSWQALCITAHAFEREERNYKRARHIAHAAYGLVRRGSQGWRKR